jgi:hypothetical protein
MRPENQKSVVSRLSLIGIAILVGVSAGCAAPQAVAPAPRESAADIRAAARECGKEYADARFDPLKDRVLPGDWKFVPTTKMKADDSYLSDEDRALIADYDAIRQRCRQSVERSEGQPDTVGIVEWAHRNDIAFRDVYERRITIGRFNQLLEVSWVMYLADRTGATCHRVAVALVRADADAFASEFYRATMGAKRMSAAEASQTIQTATEIMSSVLGLVPTEAISDQLTYLHALPSRTGEGFAVTVESWQTGDGKEALFGCAATWLRWDDGNMNLSFKLDLQLDRVVLDKNLDAWIFEQRSTERGGV